MDDPKAMLKLVFDKLNPGGRLWSELPWTDSEVWKKKGIMGFQLDAPKAFGHSFLAKGLTRIASEIGWELEGSCIWFFRLSILGHTRYMS